MRLPRPGTQTYEILSAMLKQGAQTYIQAATRCPNLSRSSFHALVAQYGLIKDDNKYGLPTWLAQLMAEGTVGSKELGQIVPARTAPPRKILTGYDAMMRQGRQLRDMSFMTTGTAFCNYADE